MPQQPFDKPQKLRLNYVWQAVEQLGRASAQEVCRRVAEKMNMVEFADSLKRTIYRDLKSLVDAGEIGVAHFRAAVQLIELDETEEPAANFRAEYFSLKAQVDLLGAEQLGEFGAKIYAPDRNVVQWRVHSASEGLPKKAFTILIPNLSGRWLALSAALEQRPMRVVVARTALLLLKFNSISRISSGVRDGHLLIEIGRDTDQIEISDLGSTSGTLVNPAREEALQQLLAA